ncbi:MAG: hypothetical protein ACLR1T_08225 [Evtepia gabavorous]
MGGPTANFRRPSCRQSSANTACASTGTASAPTPCPNLDADHTDYLLLLRKLREIPGIKKIFIRSGIRFDYHLRRTKMVNSSPTWS